MSPCSGSTCSAAANSKIEVTWVERENLKLFQLRCIKAMTLSHRCPSAMNSGDNFSVPGTDHRDSARKSRQVSTIFHSSFCSYLCKMTAPPRHCPPTSRRSKENHPPIPVTSPQPSPSQPDTETEVDINLNMSREDLYKVSAI